MDRASREALADELRRARFRTTQFREGYEESAVDDLIDAVVERLLSAGPDADAVAMVENAWIPTTKARRGYAQDDVDAALDRVVTGLGGELPPGRTAPAGPSAPLPSAVIEPPRGLLSRLFGR